MGKIRTFVKTAQNAAFDFWEGLQTTFSGIKTSIWIPKTTDTNANAAIKPKGNGANVAQDPDGTTIGGNARGQYATDWQKSRSSNNEVASGDYSTIGGGQNNSATGSQSTVGGGIANDATGLRSFIGGGLNNRASGSRATVSGGDDNAASGDRATVGGGRGNRASGDYSAVGAGQDNTASTGTHATVGGGLTNTASGGASTVGGGDANTASGGRSTVGGGEGNTASGNRATIGGGKDNTSSGTRATVSGGDNNTASNFYPAVGGGKNNTASGQYSTVSGGFRAIASRYGQFGQASGRFISDGDAQFSRYVLRTATTDATANVELFLDGTGGSNRITIPEGTAYQFHIYITSIQQTGNNAKSSEITGLIRRESGQNATIVGQHTDGNKTFNDGGFNPTYTVSADTTNQSLKIDVTGIAATNIHTVATVDITEVKYA